MTATLTPRDVARAQASAFLGLFCCGLWVTSFGPALPFIAHETGVGLGTAGFVLTAVAAGSLGLVLAAAVLLGTGDGLVVAATHSLVTITADDVPAAINRLNVFFAL